MALLENLQTAAAASGKGVVRRTRWPSYMSAWWIAVPARRGVEWHEATGRYPT